MTGDAAASTAYAVALEPVSGPRGWTLAGLKAAFFAILALEGWGTSSGWATWS